MNKIKSTLHAALLACGMAFVASPALANNPGGNVAVSEDQIDAQYDAAIAQCEAMSGDAKDICEQEAETARDKANTDREAHEDKAEADAELAEEKADARTN